MTEEEWRPIPGFPGYFASDQGRIRVGSRVMKPRREKGGYLRLGVIGADGRRYARSVHRLVLFAFVGPAGPERVTRHLNGDPADNRLSNLMFGTYSENEYDIVRHGRHYEANRTHCPSGHPYDEANTYVVPRLGHRQCRICRAAATARSDAKRRARP